jgi:SsrA-binding protein
MVGIELTGAETKSLRMGHGHLKGAYVTIKGNELFLINATIAGTSGIRIEENEQTRARRLLAKRKEIDNLIAAKQQGRTIVPLELLTGTRYIKLRISVGKGRKLYDKRQTLKERDTKRQIDRTLNNYK